MTSPEETALDDVGSGEGARSAVETLRLVLLDRVATEMEGTEVSADVLTRSAADDAGFAPGEVSVAETASTSGLDRETYESAYEAAVESLVNEIFQSLVADAIDPETARGDLLTGLSVLRADRRKWGAGREGAYGPVEGGYPSVGDLMEILPMPAFLVDADHTVLAYNEAMANLIGIGPQEALGQDNRDSIAAASYTDDRRSMSLADKVVEAPRTADEAYDVDRVLGRDWGDLDYVYEDTSTLLNRRGEEIDIAFIAIPLFDDDGRLDSVLELVEERSSGIEEFPGLAGVLSHDIRNPLTILQGSLDAIEADVDPERHELMQRSVDRIEELISGALDLARHASTEPNARRVAMDPVASRAWSAVETGDADLEIENLTLEADPQQLQQALENLFRNAVDHGGDDVTVRVGPTVEGFFVEDTGEGIPPEDRDQVFEHGYSTDRHGTGFGLPIIHKIARNHGWAIDLDESDEGGARFEFT